MEAAVVARPDTRWGETPCAFVCLTPGRVLTEPQVIEFCRQHLAHFKLPKKIIFGELPKTSYRESAEIQTQGNGRKHGERVIKYRTCRRHGA